MHDIAELLAPDDGWRWCVQQTNAQAQHVRVISSRMGLVAGAEQQHSDESQMFHALNVEAFGQTRIGMTQGNFS